MKKILYFSALAAIWLLIVFNFNVSNNKKTHQSPQLVNIQSLQASAAEWSCDGSNTNSCTINAGSGGVGYGTGVLTYRD